MAAQPDNRAALACGAVGETTAGDRRLGWVMASDLDAARRLVIAVRQFVRANTFLLTGGQVVAGSNPVSPTYVSPTYERVSGLRRRDSYRTK
jgi:hypothetical protein